MDDMERQEVSCETEAGESCSDASSSPAVKGESKVGRFLLNLMS